MFTTFIVQPIFNLLVLIYALIPGHNFGVAIILFTVIIRLLMWPLLKKQLHHAKAIRELQPEIKKIKAKAAGDKRKEQMLTMELYKEREIRPMASLGIIIVQAIILIGLYSGLSKIIKNPETIVTLSYSFIHNLSWIQTLSHDISQFDNTLLGVIDLGRKATGPEGIYWPAMLLVVGSASAQFFQGKMLMPKSEDSRSLKRILSEAGSGKSADQSEVNAAVGRSTLYLLPLFVFVISLNFAAALPLYWLTGSLVAIWQQRRILKEDVQEAGALVSTSKPIESKPGVKVSYRTEDDEPKAKTRNKKSTKNRKNKKKAKMKKRDMQVDVTQGDGEQQTDAVQDGTEKEQPQPSTKQDTKSGSSAAGSAGGQAGAVHDSEDDIEEAIQYAKKYLEDLLSFFGLNTDIYATTEDHEVIELNVPSTHLNGFLIGQRGETMRALQFMISNALRNQNFLHTRVNVDVADYKKGRAERLVEKAGDWFRDVKDSGTPKELQPMNAADRRVIHQAATDFGLETESVGEGRDRHIILKPSEKAETK